MSKVWHPIYNILTFHLCLSYLPSIHSFCFCLLFLFFLSSIYTILLFQPCLSVFALLVITFVCFVVSFFSTFLCLSHLTSLPFLLLYHHSLVISFVFCFLFCFVGSICCSVSSFLHCLSFSTFKLTLHIRPFLSCFFLYFAFTYPPPLPPLLDESCSMHHLEGRSLVPYLILAFCTLSLSFCAWLTGGVSEFRYRPKSFQSTPFLTFDSTSMKKDGPKTLKVSKLGSWDWATWILTYVNWSV